LVVIEIHGSKISFYRNIFLSFYGNIVYRVNKAYQEQNFIEKILFIQLYASSKKIKPLKIYVVLIIVILVVKTIHIYVESPSVLAHFVSTPGANLNDNFKPHILKS
jgi:hypothetical protein